MGEGRCLASPVLSKVPLTTKKCHLVLSPCGNMADGAGPWHHVRFRDAIHPDCMTDMGAELSFIVR